MAERDVLEELLRKQQTVRERLPNAWNAFYGRFGALRPIQLDSAPPILSGRNVLVTAPTAGGKTEAVVAPLCERIKSGRWPGLSVLLITPTRALVNDLFVRLERPCQNMDVRLGRKTADHAMSGGITEQLLITTPESTESLLTFRRNVLDNVRAIAIDEIHLLDGSPRGDQLRSLLSRISAYLHYRAKGKFCGLQVIALSATVPDPRRLADAYLGPSAEIISSPGQRQIESHVIVADGPDDVRAKAAVQNFDLFADVHKVLVFVNSRNQVDAGTSFFQCGPFAGFPVFGHHGSLAKEHREVTEARFKSEPRAICVATMTLEVGIDIGDIDLVVCLDPPFSLSSFLQRIGRGCRRLVGLTRVLCVARDRAGELLFHSMIRQASLGLPAGPLKPFRLSVLVQQVLAYLRQVESNCRTIDQFQRVLCHDLLPTMGSERLHLLLQDMVRQELLDLRGKVYQPARLGWEFIESSRIYGNIGATPYEVALVDADTGAMIANVASVQGTSVRIAGKSYQIVPGGSPDKHKVRATTAEASSPKYHTGGLPYSADLGASVAGYFGIDQNTLAVVVVGGGIVVMTWLGKLLNAALGYTLKQAGCTVKVNAFSLTLRSQTPAEAMHLITNAARKLLETNPLAQIKVEQMADVGPYFLELSDQLKEIARGDWLDQAFLAQWVNSLSISRLIDSKSELGRDLLEFC